MKLLISDDNPTIQKLLKSNLERYGHEVVCTSNGREAYKVIQQPGGPQIALIDWMMPEMDGLTLCRELRKHPLRHPLYLILITSREDKKDIISGLEAGADDYITKPIDLQELYARINVGCRVVAMHTESLGKEKLQGVVEMAGAVCHEINQPLQIILGNSELLLHDLPESDPNHSKLHAIREAVQRIGTLTNRIMTISSYSTKSHLDGKVQIIDLEKSSGNI